MSDEQRLTVLKRITHFMHRRARPTYLGEIAAHVDYDLERTGAFLQELLDDGRVRRLTDEDKASLRIDVRAELWDVVDRHPDDDTD